MHLSFITEANLLNVHAMYAMQSVAQETYVLDD